MHSGETRFAQIVTQTEHQRRLEVGVALRFAGNPRYRCGIRCPERVPAVRRQVVAFNSNNTHLFRKAGQQVL